MSAIRIDLTYGFRGSVAVTKLVERLLPTPETSVQIQTLANFIFLNDLFTIYFFTNTLISYIPYNFVLILK